MFAEATQDPNTGSLPARLTSMAQRFVARRICSKPLVLRDTPPMVSFTFDDVPASACEVGAPILERHGARGTFYIAGGGCGTGSPDGPMRASMEQLRTVWKKGHEIGCHTYSHPTVRRMSNDGIGAEIDRNQVALKVIDAGIVIRNFAYPFGDLSVRTKRYLESRFDSCRSAHAGINSGVADLGALDAWPLDSASLDRSKIATLIDETARSRGWLIFHSHDVAERPSRYGVTPDLLEWAVGTARQAGCILATVAGALSIIRNRAAND